MKSEPPPRTPHRFAFFLSFSANSLLIATGSESNNHRTEIGLLVTAGEARTPTPQKMRTPSSRRAQIPSIVRARLGPIRDNNRWQRETAGQPRILLSRPQAFSFLSTPSDRRKEPPRPVPQCSPQSQSEQTERQLCPLFTHFHRALVTIKTFTCQRTSRRRRRRWLSAADIRNLAFK